MPIIIWLKLVTLYHVHICQIIIGMMLRSKSPLCTLLTVAAFTGAVVLSDAADGFLAANAGQRAHDAVSSRKDSQDRLRVDAAHLAAALRALLGNCPNGKCSKSVVTAARDRLGKEAGWMQREDPEAAALLRAYAKSATPSVLLMPQEAQITRRTEEQQPLAEEQQPRAGDQQPLPSAHIMSAASNEFEESFSGLDGAGNVVKHTRHCKNGRCVERTERSTAPKDASNQAFLGSRSDSSLPASSDSSDKDLLSGPFPTMNRSMMSPLSGDLPAAVRAMARDMKTLHESFGPDTLGFDGFMKDAFTDPKMPDWDEFNSGLDTADTETGQEKDVKSNAADAEAEGVQALSSSNSTETRISHGRLVTTKRHCRNGECTTTIKIVDRKRPNEQGGEPQHTDLHSA
mmetsp:Transcript_128856/g.222514  ORF Transcript_128856/g.222514 Transcript_128856/m.222514 type:complete len:401 (-) Transcript_128856:17-1219(-)